MKAVAALVSARNGQPHLLCFDHPEAGTQIVKGRVEEGESLQTAVLRELREESGLRLEAPLLRHIGSWSPAGEPTWHIQLITTEQDLPERWLHDAEGSPEEERHRFAFRWLPVDEELERWLAPVFGPVAEIIRDHVADM